MTPVKVPDVAAQLQGMLMLIKGHLLGFVSAKFKFLFARWKNAKAGICRAKAGIMRKTFTLRKKQFSRAQVSVSAPSQAFIGVFVCFQNNT